MRVAVDLASGVPPYEQIRSQVTALVAAAHLVPGDRLPTVRDLAADLGVAVGTVQRAYRELEAAGTVHSRRRVGTVVAETVATAATAHPVRRAAALFVQEARAAGVGDAEILDLVRGALMSDLVTDEAPVATPGTGGATTADRGSVRG
ncbi:GntR family transcriptional regulator [Georgenia subflava]|uniref:GntR family transcriptional regulator n=1 Tax=Georgenia subflava TaxID=1622177 RepID=A0A6N7ERF5_9MICO|nr:GntR family transcriptional regulator [Georgenia subflava]MPV37754.1 GntR family transcriptional regulator [Georgenia subflava]